MPAIFDIPEFKAGQSVRGLRTQLNGIRKAILALKPCNTPDITSHCSAIGTTWRLAKRPVGGGGNSEHPFLVVDASDVAPDTPAAKVTVVFGQVNNFTPTIGAVALDVVPAPELTVVTGVVYLDATVDGSGLITGVVVANAATVPADTSTHGYKVLATVTVVSNAVTALNQSVTHSLGHQKCGATIHNFWGV